MSQIVRLECSWSVKGSDWKTASHVSRFPLIWLVWNMHWVDNSEKYSLSRIYIYDTGWHIPIRLLNVQFFMGSIHIIVRSKKSRHTLGHISV